MAGALKKLSLLLLFLNACSGTSCLRSMLENRGPLGLSSENPYLSANTLLAQEMESSPIVRGFVDFRGTPDGIEIRKKLFSPYRMYFFYLKDLEGYLLEERNNQWLIRGPEKIPVEILPRLAAISPLSGKAALSIPSIHPAELGAEDAPLTLRGALSCGEKPKESGESRTLSRDVLHEVTYPGETLRLISTWYTGDARNANAIAVYNNLSNPNQLALGQRLRIPRELVRQTESLPLHEVDRYLATVVLAPSKRGRQ